MTQQIDYYFSTISPYAYLAGDRMERIAAGHPAEITYKPLDIMQLFYRTGDVRLKMRHKIRPACRMQKLAPHDFGQNQDKTPPPIHLAKHR